MIRTTPVTTDNSIHQQIEMEDNEERPKNAKTYNQQNVLPYTWPPIHNTSQWAKTYNPHKALQYNEQAITYNPQKALQ